MPSGGRVFEVVDVGEKIRVVLERSPKSPFQKGGEGNGGDENFGKFTDAPRKHSLNITFYNFIGSYEEI